MAKIRILNRCEYCPCNCDNGCTDSSGFKNRRMFNKEELKLIENGGFPEWCPLEDYKNGA